MRLATIIPVRDRDEQRIINCIKSVKSDDVLIVDYGSKDPVDIKMPGVRTLRVERRDYPVWNKAHALNLGIKNTDSQYIQVIDCDIILPPSFYDSAKKRIGPDSFVLSRKVRRIEDFTNYQDSLEVSTPWHNREDYDKAVGGVQIFPRAWAEKYGGYHESLSYWGGMDTYLYFLALRSGLKVHHLDEVILHQEHENRKEDNLEDDSERVRAQSIRIARTRNKEIERLVESVFIAGNWGEEKRRTAPLVAVYNVFNEAGNIEKSIESIYDYVDEILVFDGAYRDFPHKKAYSTDGMLEIVEKYDKVKVYGAVSPYVDQCQKRTEMFVKKPGTFYLKIDGDERCLNPWELERINYNFMVGYGLTQSDLYLEPYNTIRLMAHQKSLGYKGRHHWLFKGDQFLASDQAYDRNTIVRYTPLQFENIRATGDRNRDKMLYLSRRDETKESEPGENIAVLLRAGIPMASPRRTGVITRSLCIPLSGEMSWFEASQRLGPDEIPIGVADNLEIIIAISNRRLYNRVINHSRALGIKNVRTILSTQDPIEVFKESANGVIIYPEWAAKMFGGRGRTVTIGRKKFISEVSNA